MREYFKSYNDKMENILPSIESESVDIVLTDPPYLYLKNQEKCVFRFTGKTCAAFT